MEEPRLASRTWGTAAVGAPKHPGTKYVRFRTDGGSGGDYAPFDEFPLHYPRG